MRTACLVLSLIVTAAPCVSGPQPGKRPGPYSFVMSTGDNRGKSHCYICETEDRPAVIVFARAMGEATGRLVSALDKQVAANAKADLRGWVTLLHEDQSAIDRDVVKWAKAHNVVKMPVGTFEDADGPPSYKLSRDAEVTVLLFVKQKVVANHAFRAAELNDAKIKAVVADVAKILPAAK